MHATAVAMIFRIPSEAAWATAVASAQLELGYAAFSTLAPV